MCDKSYLSTIPKELVFLYSAADLGFVKLVVMINIFFNYHKHEIESKQLICLKQIKSGFFSNSWNQHFYSWYMQNIKTSLYRKLNIQSNLAVHRLGVRKYFKIYFTDKIWYGWLLALSPSILRLVEVSRRTW